MLQALTWIYAGLALGSLVSVIVRRPWTALVARRSTPRAAWDSRLFRETNAVISTGWSLFFAVAALLCATAPPWLSTAYGALLVVLGRWSPRFGAWYAARRQ